MGVYVNEKLVTLPDENKPADDAARHAAETWRTEHAGDAAVEPEYDEHGRQTNRPVRLEVVVEDAPTFKVTQMSDGTVRKDNRQPAAPPPAKVTVDTQYRYTAEDHARMTSGEYMRVGGEGGGERVATQAASTSKNWLDKPSQR